VYTFDGARPRFHRAPPPTALELERLLDTLIRRMTRTLVRSGALVAQEYDDEEQLWLDLDSDVEDALTQLQGASIRYRIAVGSIAGRKTLRLHTPGASSLDGAGREQPKPFTAARDGFSLNAAVACKAGDRRKLERLCRYVARPAIALERLSRDGDGLMVYELKHPFRDGTTHVSRSRASLRFAALVHPCTACSSRSTSVALGILPPATLVHPCTSSPVSPRWCRGLEPISCGSTACSLQMPAIAASWCLDRFPHRYARAPSRERYPLALR
jgi:hypothetical protein